LCIFDEVLHPFPIPFALTFHKGFSKQALFAPFYTIGDIYSCTEETQKQHMWVQNWLKNSFCIIRDLL